MNRLLVEAGQFADGLNTQASSFQFLKFVRVLSSEHSVALPHAVLARIYTTLRGLPALYLAAGRKCSLVEPNTAEKMQFAGSKDGGWVYAE